MYLREGRHSVPQRYGFSGESVFYYADRPYMGSSQDRSALRRLLGAKGAFMTQVFTEPLPGEWVQPQKQGYLLKCCDCGLVHRMDFRVVKNGGPRQRFIAFIQGARYRVQFRAYRVSP